MPSEEPFFEELPRQFGPQPSIAQVTPHAAVVFGAAGGSVCTGSLIALDLVLTLARCLYLGGERVDNESTVQVFVGVNHLLHLNSPGVQEGVVERLISHPGFRYGPDEAYFGYNDLLIIQLKEFFNETEHVKPVAVGEMEWGGEPVACHFAGYGSVNPVTVDWEADSALKVHNVHATRRCACRDALLAHFGPSRVNRWICMEPEKGGFWPCVGAGGAGLVCEGRLAGVLAGLVPFGQAGQCRFARRPAASCRDHRSLVVFIDLCAYQRWLHFQFGHLPAGPAGCAAAAPAALSASLAALAPVSATLLLTS